MYHIPGNMNMACMANYKNMIQEVLLFTSLVIHQKYNFFWLPLTDWSAGAKFKDIYKVTIKQLLFRYCTLNLSNLCRFVYFSRLIGSFWLVKSSSVSGQWTVKLKPVNNVFFFSIHYVSTNELYDKNTN